MPQKDVAILFGMLALGACASSGSKTPDSAAGTPPTRPERAVAANIEPELLYEKVAPSILRVETFRSNAETGDIEPVAAGSAIAVGPSAYLTSCHVLGGGQHIAIVQDDRPIMADLDTSHHRADVCLIRTKKPVGAPVTGFREFADIRVGERVYTVGNPQGFDLTLADGIVSSKRRREDETRWVQTTAPISPGSSGGGLFDARGNLIGITNFYWEDGQQLNFASAIEPDYLPRTGQVAAIVKNPVAAPTDLGVAEGEREVESAIAALLAAAANRDGDNGNTRRSFDRRTGRTGSGADDQDDAGSGADDGQDSGGSPSDGNSGSDDSGSGSDGSNDDSGSNDSGSDNGGSGSNAGGSGGSGSGSDGSDSGDGDSGSDDSGSDDSDASGGGSNDSGSDDSGSDDSGSGSDDSGSDDSGSDDSGSGSDDSGSSSDDSGSDDSGPGSDDDGSDNSGSGSDDTGSDDSGSDDSGSGRDDSSSGSGNGRSGNDSDDSDSDRGSRGRGSSGRGSDRGGSDDGGDSDD